MDDPAEQRPAVEVRRLHRLDRGVPLARDEELGGGVGIVGVEHLDGVGPLERVLALGQEEHLGVEGPGGGGIVGPAPRSGRRGVVGSVAAGGEGEDEEGEEGDDPEAHGSWDGGGAHCGSCPGGGWDTP